MRNVLLLVLLLCAIWWVRRAMANLQAQRLKRKQAQARISKAEPILACRHCGVHVPESAGLRDEHGKFYCSEAHRQLHHDD